MVGKNIIAIHQNMSAIIIRCVSKARVVLITQIGQFLQKLGLLFVSINSPKILG